MKIVRIAVLAFIALSILPTTVRAGDYATLNFIGFSKDGKYLAFEEFGMQDGSGFTYSTFYFIDVEKNSFASPPVKAVIQDELATEPMARSKAKRSADPILRRLRIVERNTGKLVVSRLMTDISAYATGGEDSKSTSRNINFAELVGSMYRRGFYELVLKSSDIAVKECEYTEEPAQKLELVLKDNDSDKTLVLQKDVNLPASRSCATRYEIQYVYLYENYIAVFLNTYHRGFEGPDVRYMAVTGKYK